jgi:FdrA protein
MIIKGAVKKGEYYDSVTLMKAARKLREISGVVDCAVVMGTAENLAILEASGLMVAEFADCRDTELLIAASAEEAATAERALSEAEFILKTVHKREGASAAPLPHSLDAALQMMPDANLAMISVAGKYAADEAMKALRHGLHVMLFSDNVPLEPEIALKEYAVERNLLLMGPDCGTAIINGVPLAFANAVRRGAIGIVAAAGTGLQEVSCLVSNSGAGISQAIGTGGRDVKEAVGGRMFLHALRLLADDPETKIIVLISKPPHASVLKKIAKETQTIRKPVVAAFLGANTDAIRDGEMLAANSLHEAALMAVTLLQGKPLGNLRTELSKQQKAIKELAKVEARKLHAGQKYIRGLFSGGTFCYEGQFLLHDVIRDIYSNAPTGKSQKLADSLKSTKHTLIDLGEDVFTVGRPHPMIDYSLRNQRIIAEATDPETAVILLDVVLGYGSNPDPLAEIIPAISQARESAAAHKQHLPIVCSATGTDADPQNRSRVVKGLRDAGVIVAESNAAASQLTGYIVQNE